MTFDPVHDTQIVHRALLKAFSFPGTAVSIAGPASRAADKNLPAALAAVVLTLLDSETTCWSADAAVSDLAGCPRRPRHEAAFVFAAGGEAWDQAFVHARRGTLADPHLGATVVGWTGEADPEQGWTASGPGLEHPRVVSLPAGDWVWRRNEACAEFPLGVDLVWVRGDSVVALPRTTRLTPGGEA